MATSSQIEPLYRIAEIARMLHVSRATVYNLLRGSKIVDLGGKSKKGVKLVPESVLREILDRKTKTFR
jgi:predicted transcriptional regulator